MLMEIAAPGGDFVGEGGDAVDDGHKAFLGSKGFRRWACYNNYLSHRVLMKGVPQQAGTVRPSRHVRKPLCRLAGRLGLSADTPIL
jgi:hypothetical protein